MILAFMNLLPIPALDGGHAMFLSYEIISGKKPSEKFLEYYAISKFVNSPLNNSKKCIDPVDL